MGWLPPTVATAGRVLVTRSRVLVTASRVLVTASRELVTASRVLVTASRVLVTPSRALVTPGRVVRETRLFSVSYVPAFFRSSSSHRAEIAAAAPFAASCSARSPPTSARRFA